MKKAVIELDGSQLLGALEQLPADDIKNIIDALVSKRLFKQPDFEDISAKARRTVKRQGLKPDVVEEAVRWARKQK